MPLVLQSHPSSSFTTWLVFPFVISEPLYISGDKSFCISCCMELCLGCHWVVYWQCLIVRLLEPFRKPQVTLQRRFYTAWCRFAESRSVSLGFEKTGKDGVPIGGRIHFRNSNFRKIRENLISRISRFHDFKSCSVTLNLPLHSSTSA